MIIIGQGTRNVGEMLWAPDTPKVYEGIVSLSTGFEPVVPVIAPLAASPQLLRQALTAGLVQAPPVIVVTVEVARGVSSELCWATIGEDALPSPRNLQVEAVLSIHIIPNVRDLHNHALADEVGVRTSPIPISVLPVGELQLKALPAVGVSRQTMTATHRDR